MGFQLDSKPTKRRDLIIFLIALLAMAYFFRDQLGYFIDDQGYFLKYDAGYDEYLIAADQVHPMAMIIQDRCNRDNMCPGHPAGWNHDRDKVKSFRGSIEYRPLQSGIAGGETRHGPFTGFTIIYDYSPGWRLVAHGGIGASIKMERVRTDQNMQ